MLINTLYYSHQKQIYVKKEVFCKKGFLKILQNTQESPFEKSCNASGLHFFKRKTDTDVFL